MRYYCQDCGEELTNEEDLICLKCRRRRFEDLRSRGYKC